MKPIKTYFNDKYLRIEIAFFVFYYFLFNILTTVEYNLVEPRIMQYPNPLNYTNHFVFALVRIIPVWILYKAIIQKYLFNKKYLQFVLLLVLYLVLLNFYNLYINGLIAHLSFLPQSVIEEAAGKYKADVLIHYGGTMYMLREYMVLLFLAYFIRSARQEGEMNQLKQQQLNAELNYLKGQLQPHFFFNTLNNIYSLALKQSKDTAPIVAKLADMMRYILYEADQPKVLLSKEINFLRNYIEVEQIRHQQNTIKFDVQGVNEALYIEPLLMLPFIENAFKHGLEQETEKGFVNIIVCVIENELTLDVTNSKPQQQNLVSGIGLQNVSKRLELLYPHTHQLEVKNESNTYHVTLTLQLA